VTQISNAKAAAVANSQIVNRRADDNQREQPGEKITSISLVF